MDIAGLCVGAAPSSDELALVSEFVRATNAGELASLASLFSDDAQVNDQLRNFWGRAEITAWLDREFIGEQVKLSPINLKRHYDVAILHAAMTGSFEAPVQPMLFDLHFTVKDMKIIRLLILLAREDAPEPELRRVS